MRRLVFTVVICLAYACCFRPVGAFAANDAAPAKLGSLFSGDNLFVLDTLASEFYTTCQTATEALATIVVPRLLEEHGQELGRRLEHCDPVPALAFEFSRGTHLIEARFCITGRDLTESFASPHPSPTRLAQLPVIRLRFTPAHVGIKEWLETPGKRSTPYPTGRISIDEKGAITAQLATAMHHVHIALEQVDVEIKPSHGRMGKTLTLRENGRRKLAARLARRPGFRVLLQSGMIRRADNSPWPAAIHLRR